MNKSILDKIMIEASTDVYLKPEKDFPMNTPQFYRIVDGKYIRALYGDKQVICLSNDMVTGKIFADGERQECAMCDKQDACKPKCQLIMENLQHGNVYHLAIPHGAHIRFSEYVRDLLVNNTDAPDVVTEITRIKDGKFSSYIFTKACEWLEEAELNNIKPIINEYNSLSEDDREDFDIAMMLKLKGFEPEKINIIMKLLGYNNE